MSSQYYAVSRLMMTSGQPARRGHAASVARPRAWPVYLAPGAPPSARYPPMPSVYLAPGARPVARSAAPPSARYPPYA
eukprot:scaffold70350_cov63-Phaeocystis_antarctica.AAC.3